MNRVTKQLHKSLKYIVTRNWEKIYVAVDVHDTCMESTYSDKLSHTFYPDCLDTLRMLSNRADISLILWTSSNEENCAAYKQMFEERGIVFNYTNSNPEVTDKHYANYEDKFYVNLILDDKAGFDPIEDWPALKEYLQKLKFKETWPDNLLTEDINKYLKQFD